MLVGWRFEERLPLSLLLSQGQQVAVGSILDGLHGVTKPPGVTRLAEREASEPRDLVLVALLQGGCELLVIAFEGNPGGVRNLVVHECARGADEGVAATDVAFQERERQARID